MLQAGTAIRSAMDAWLEGLRELRDLLPFVSPTGQLRSLGVALATDGSIDTSWPPADQQLSDVFCLYPPYAPPELDAANPVQVRPGWGPSRGTTRVARFEGWQWEWTRDLIGSSLKALLERRALPARPGSILAAERDWLIAHNLLSRKGNVLHAPIDPTSIVSAIEMADARADGKLHTLQFMDGTLCTRSERYRLASRCEQLAGNGGQLTRPAPAPDAQLAGGWVWTLYSAERLRELVEFVWREALIAYGQLVADYFPHVGRMLGIAALGRPVVRGTLVISDKRGIEGAPALDYLLSSLDPAIDLDLQTPLVPGTPAAQPEVAISLATEEEWRSNPGRTPAHTLTKLIPQGSIATAFAAPDGAYTAKIDAYDESPVTALVYRWLTADLQRLGLV